MAENSSLLGQFGRGRAAPVAEFRRQPDYYGAATFNDKFGGYLIKLKLFIVASRSGLTTLLRTISPPILGTLWRTQHCCQFNKKYKIQLHLNSIRTISNKKQLLILCRKCEEKLCFFYYEKTKYRYYILRRQWRHIWRQFWISSNTAPVFCKLLN